MHGENADSSALHLYCHLFMRQGPCFLLENLYGRYYAALRGAVGRGRLDADVDADADEEGEAKDVGEDE